MRAELSRIESYESYSGRVNFLFNPSPSDVQGFVRRYGVMSERWLQIEREKEVRGVISYETGDYNFYLFDPLITIHVEFSAEMGLDRYVPVYVSPSFVIVAIGGKSEDIPGFVYKSSGGQVLNKEDIVEYIQEIPNVRNAFKNGQFKVIFESVY